MSRIIRINHVILQAEEFHLDVLENKKRKIQFQFKVTSEDYHEVTTLFYKDDFEVEIPNEKLIFHARIQNYYTSITDLYQKGEVGTFTLELIEK